MKKVYLFLLLSAFGIVNAQNSKSNKTTTTTTCTSADPGTTPGETGCITFNYGNQTVEYATVRAADGQIWLLQNLGSSQIATSATDEDAYGDLYQWGRWTDGHQKRTSALTNNAISPNNPTGLNSGQNTFIASTPKWWNDNPALTDKWEATTVEAVQADNGCDPCRLIGEGWRLPTEAEWTAIIATENITNIATAYESNLKLTIAGNRSGSSGTISSAGVRGYYWSSTVSASNVQYSKYFYFSNITINASAGASRDQGSSVRCLKSQTVITPATLAITVQNNAPAQIATNGGMLQLTALITPAAASQSVTWSITEGNAFATVDQNGQVTALANGSITVQAISNANNTVSNTINITITNQATTPQSLTINVANDAPAAITTNAGTLQLDAVIAPTAASQDVTWSITDGTGIAAINENGLVIALANGTVTVQATSIADITVSNTIQISISNQAAAPQNITINIADNAAPLIHTQDGTLQLNAVITPEDASQDVIWSITAGNSLATINAEGIVTADNDGILTVTATSIADPSLFSTIAITVINQNPASAAPYCDVTAEWDVEPISLVQFAGIDNATPAAINATAAYENFTNLSGTVHQGETYTLTVKGNTAGLYAHDIRAFIDWNQNNVFDMETEYFATTIENTTGDDDVTATLSITVPPDAVTGTTRMRITKDLWTAYEPGEFDGCTDAYYGQVEDYSLNITEASLATGDFTKATFTVYPNPVSNIVNIQADKDIAKVKVYNSTGQLIAETSTNAVNLSLAAAGIYILKAEFTDGSALMQKIIKK